MLIKLIEEIYDPNKKSSGTVKNTVSEFINRSIQYCIEQKQRLREEYEKKYEYNIDEDDYYDSKNKIYYQCYLLDENGNIIE